MRLRLVAVTMAALLAIACSEPPHKEMHQAQGAIEAARAAGAEIYAPEEFREAEQMLQESEESVAQRDYRLALRYALDARERAYEAARATANGKAEARAEAERALAAADAVVAAAAQRLTAAQAVRARAADIAPLRRAVAEENESLQKARAAMEEENFLGVPAIVEGVEARLGAAIEEVDRRTALRAPRRRR
jgi:hypothetical protein